MYMQYKLGKKSARKDPRTLRLMDYASLLPPAPSSCNLSSKMTNIGMMLNDSLGDCTCATVGHIIQQWTAACGSQIILPDSDILALYEKVGGYVAGNPSTDEGAVALDVLNYWAKNGISDHNLVAYACLDTNHIAQAKAAIYYFGAAYIGVELPESAAKQNIWDVPWLGTLGKGKKGSWGGHAIPIVAYDSSFVYCVTWGEIKAMTWSFYTTYCDEAYALLSMDWINTATKLSPENFDLAALQLDLHNIRVA